jgi:(S)-sulfolactate dehydrogenase
MVDVLVTEALDPESLAELRRDHEVHYDPTLCERPDEIIERAPGVRGLILRNRTRICGRVLAAFDKLRVIGRHGVGLDNIDVAECARRRIRVCPAYGANAVSVAEYVVAASLIGLRDVWHASGEVGAGTWPREALTFHEARGKVLGLIGFGDIARKVVPRARALGLEIIACGRPGRNPRRAGVEPVTLEALLARADIVSLHAPLTDDTKGLIDSTALERMKPGAVFINTARGGMVDEAALIRALRSGRLRAGFLDVFETEPLPAGSPLVGVPNLILTPHVSGVTIEANRRVGRITVENVRRALARGRGSC